MYTGVVVSFLPRCTNFSNHRVLTRVNELLDRSTAFMCFSVSKTWPGNPVSVSVLSFSSKELPTVMLTFGIPANVSACRVVSVLPLRSRYRNGMPWKSRGGSVSNSLPPRSKCVADVK